MAGKKIQAGEAFVGLGIKNKLRQGLRGAKAQLDGFGRGARRIGTGFAVAGGAIVGAFTPAIRIFAAFDDKMRAVQGFTQATTADFAMLTEKAKLLGRTTSFTAVDVAGLMGELGKAGFKPDQIDKMTTSVLSLAKATGTDATESAGIMAATIRQFGLGAGDAARVADDFTIAANNSFNTVSQLGTAMSFSGKVAADMGMSVEDTLAILGGLGNVGIQGSMAGTAMRRLTVLTGAEADKMQSIFGVAFKDSAGNARPLVDVLGEVNEATKDLGTSERAKKFSDAFGLLGITAASSIASAGNEIGNLKDLMIDGTGTAQKTAEKMEAGIGGSFRKLISATEGVAIAVGEAVAGPLAGLAAMAVTVAGAITAWVGQNSILVTSIAALGGFLLVVGAGLIAAGAAASIFSFALATATTIVGGLVAIFGALLSPVGLVVAAIVAAGVAFFAFTETGRSVVDWFTKNFGMLYDAVSSTLGSIFDALQSGDLGLAAEIGFTGIKLAVGTVMDEVERIFGISFKKLFTQIANFWKYIAETLNKIDKLRQKGVNAIAQAMVSPDKERDERFSKQEAERKRHMERLGLEYKENAYDVASVLTDNQNAAGFSDLFDTDFDPEDVGKSFNDAFDVDDLTAKLEALKAEAAAARSGGTGPGGTPAPGGNDFPQLPLPPDLAVAMQSAFANFSGLSASAAVRSGPGAQSIEKKMLDEIKKIAPAIEANTIAVEESGEVYK